MSQPDNTAGTTAKASAELERALAGISLPAITEALNAFTADLGQPGQEPSSIRKAYGEIRSNLRQDFESVKNSSAATVKQQALQSGMNYNPQAVNEALTTVATNLQGSEMQQLRALNFAESQAGLNQTNALLSNITGTAGNLLSGAFRFGGNALQSDQILRQYQQQAQQQGSTYGALAGTVLGGLLGTFAFPGLGTAAGAALGGGLGGAAGGYFGGNP